MFCRIRSLDNIGTIVIDDVLDAVKHPSNDVYLVYDKDGTFWHFYTEAFPKCELVEEIKPPEKEKYKEVVEFPTAEIKVLNDPDGKYLKIGLDQIAEIKLK